MRISDWSSDVCSSDLLVVVLLQRQADSVDLRPALPVERDDQQFVTREPPAGNDRVAVGRNDDVAAEHQAARSEARRVGRVCQNVYISVVAASLKKKTSQIHKMLS